ncbi:MAG: hypothetical protein H7338_10320 [Candidatus Sericytochromatia bacterium]|nr:hypothetical protein [Candidatus Sericytochromatia bacterium]
MFLNVTLIGPKANFRMLTMTGPDEGVTVGTGLAAICPDAGSPDEKAPTEVGAHQD